jgi:putative tricarboxylic transport membrane protein
VNILQSESIFTYFITLFQPVHLLFCLLGAVLGNLVGVLPGLGPPAALAILLPLTTYMSPVDMLIMMAAIYYGAMYGGTITSVLINIPGEASSVVTCIDGYQMTKQGRGAEALAIAAIGSFLAGTLSILPLQLFAPPLAELALAFGPPEYMGLLLMSFVTLVGFSEQLSLIKGLVMLVLGMGLTTIGVDPLAGAYRLCFGPLVGGFDLIPVLMGLFGLGEVLMATGEDVQNIYKGKLGRLIPPWPELVKGLKSSVRGGLIGFILGLLPGMLPSVTTFIAYDVERRVSKYPEKFGTGVIEGVAAPEAANNATAMSGFIPLLSLGVPTTPALGIFFAGLMIYGLKPGPLLFQLNADIVWPLIASMYLANVILLVLNLPLAGIWARAARIPYHYIAAIVLSICLVGAYSARNMIWDVWVCLAFGFLGYALRYYQWPIVPLILGMILGDKFEESLRQSLEMSGGSFNIFFARPICLGFLITGMIILLAPPIIRNLRSRR